MRVTAQKLEQEIRAILKDSDLESLSKKKVRRQLEETFGVKLKSRKKAINDIVDKVLAELVEQEKEEEEEYESEGGSSDAWPRPYHLAPHARRGHTHHARARTSRPIAAFSSGDWSSLVTQARRVSPNPVAARRKNSCRRGGEQARAKNCCDGFCDGVCNQPLR